MDTERAGVEAKECARKLGLDWSKEDRDTDTPIPKAALEGVETGELG